MSFSCKKTEIERVIELPETSVISSNSRWGVVIFPYIRVRKSPDKNDIITAAFRQGDIVKIMKSTEFRDSSSPSEIYKFGP